MDPAQHTYTWKLITNGLLQQHHEQLARCPRVKSQAQMFTHWQLPQLPMDGLQLVTHGLLQLEK